MHYNVLSQFVEKVIEKIVKCLVNKKMLVSHTNPMPRMAKITWLSVMALAMTASFSQCGHKYGFQRKFTSDTNQSQNFSSSCCAAETRSGPAVDDVSQESSLKVTFQAKLLDGETLRGLLV